MKIRVMIVDDSLFMRAMLRYVIESDPLDRFEVVANATDGNDAIRKLRTTPIDVITLDVEMPYKNGLETLKDIMKDQPKPVIMLSSLTKPNATTTVEALTYGAFDFITKPDDAKELKAIREEILTKLFLASKAAGKVKPPVTQTWKPVVKARPVIKPERTAISNVIAIGTSTGGPNALREIIRQFPENFNGAVVIAQHMPEGNFTTSLAKHLDQMASLHVKEAEHNERVQQGYVYIAPGGKHLELKQDGSYVKMVIHERQSLHKPSVDFLFFSLAELSSSIKKIGIVLTGMGSDGKMGAHLLKEKGAIILAESEETCVVYGMPRKIIEFQLADYVEPLPSIVPRTLGLLN